MTDEGKGSTSQYVLSQIILAVEFLAKQGLPFRGHWDNKVDFSIEDAIS